MCRSVSAHIFSRPAARPNKRNHREVTEARKPIRSDINNDHQTWARRFGNPSKQLYGLPIFVGRIVSAFDDPGGHVRRQLVQEYQKRLEKRRQEVAQRKRQQHFRRCLLVAAVFLGVGWLGSTLSMGFELLSPGLQGMGSLEAL